MSPRSILEVQADHNNSILEVPRSKTHACLSPRPCVSLSHPNIMFHAAHAVYSRVLLPVCNGIVLGRHPTSLPAVPHLRNTGPPADAAW